MGLKQTETTQVVVGEKNFYITKFPAFKAANLTGELTSLLAPLFGVLAPLVDDDSTDGLGDVDVTKAASALSGCADISGDKLELLMQKLLLGGHIAVEVEDEEGNVEAERLTKDVANEVFCGDVQDMFVLCFHVIKLNYNGFFKKFGNLSGKVKAAEGKTTRKIL